MQRVGAFTLIELLVAMGIIALLASVGVGLGWPVISSHQMRGDRDVIVTLLERARNQSLTNSNATPHGVAFINQNYIGFEGSSYASRDTAKDLVYPQAGGVAVSAPSEVVFAPLSARASASTVTLQAGERTSVIHVNQEGSIDW